MRSVIDVPSLRGGLRLESLREAERGDRGDRERERESVGRTNTHTQTARRPIENLFPAVAAKAMPA